MYAMKRKMTTIHLFDYPIENITKDEAVQKILQILESETYQPVYFINANCVNIAHRDQEYQNILKSNHLNLADGVGMKIASRILGNPLVDNVNGTDLFPILCRTLDLLETSPRIFLLGGLPGVAEELKDKMLERYPNLTICGTHHGHFPKKYNETIEKQILNSNADLLFIAMGVPLQEKWIDRHGANCGVKVALGVGGLFNFYSGRISRAPQWMQNLGIEWLHRLWKEPIRLWKRYLVGNVIFLLRTVFRVVKTRLFK